MSLRSPTDPEALNLEPLRTINPLQVEATVYFRHVFRPFSGPPDPLFVRPHEGRWATAWTLHTANAVHVALAEYCRSKARDVARADVTGGFGLTQASLPALGPLQVGDALPQRALFGLTFEFERLVNLTFGFNMAALFKSGFGRENFFADDYGRCPDLARIGEALGWEALIAPSAAWQHSDGYSIAIFGAGRVQLRRTVMLEAAIRPSVAVAFATTYRAGQRPRWLEV